MDHGYVPIADASVWFDSVAPLDLAAWEVAAARSRAWADHLRHDFTPVIDGVVGAASLDSGAIEGLYETDRGLTLTTLRAAAGWEAEVARRTSAETLRLVRGHVDGFRLALDAATQSSPISQAWIRQLHEKVCEGQDTYEVTVEIDGRRSAGLSALPKGTYKRGANHVELADGSTHWYAPPDAVQAEMQRLVEQSRTDAFLRRPAPLQAAYLHHTFTQIHPFADGNGRVARVLASVPLIRATSLPLLIFAEQKTTYFDALDEADRGRPTAFAEFVVERSLRLMELVDIEIQARPGTPDMPPGPSDDPWRITEARVYDELWTRISDLVLDDPIASVLRTSVEADRPADHSHSIFVALPDPRPGVGGALITRSESGAVGRVVVDVRAGASMPPLVFERDDIVPEMTTEARLRLDGVARLFVRRVRDNLAQP